AEQAGVVQQAVEAAVLGIDAIGEFQVVVPDRAFEVHGVDRRARTAGGKDLVIDLLELVHRAAEQDDGRARLAERDAHRAADAVARAGDQHDAIVHDAGGWFVGGNLLDRWHDVLFSNGGAAFAARGVSAFACRAPRRPQARQRIVAGGLREQALRG